LRDPGAPAAGATLAVLSVEVKVSRCTLGAGAALHIELALAFARAGALGGKGSPFVALTALALVSIVSRSTLLAVWALEALQTVAGTSIRLTVSRGAGRITGAGQTGFGKRCIQLPVESTLAELALIASRVIGAALADALVQEGVVGAALGMTIALADFTLSAQLKWSVLEEWTALVALITAGIVLADALQQGISWRFLGAIGMTMAIQAGTDLQLGE